VTHIKNSLSQAGIIIGIIVLINVLLIGALFIAKQQIANLVTTNEIILIGNVLLISTVLLCCLLIPVISFRLLSPLRSEVIDCKALLVNKDLENQLLFEALDEYAPISLADLSGRIIYANSMFCEVSGYREQDFEHQEVNIINLELQDPKFMTEVWRSLNREQVWEGKVLDTTKQGHEYWAENTIFIMQGPDGKPRQYVTVRRDSTLAKKNEINQALLLHLLNADPNMLMVTDALGHIMAINTALANFTGWQLEQLKDQLPEIMSTDHTDENTLTEMKNSLQQGKVWSGRILNQRPSEESDSEEVVDSSEYWVDITTTPLFNAKHEFIGCLQVQQDITNNS